MKTNVIIVGLVLLLVANFIMLYVAPYGVSASEGFQATNAVPPMNAMPPTNAVPSMNMEEETGPNSGGSEGFQSFFLENAGGAKERYQPMGAYDGVKLPTGNPSQWRYTAPNEPLMGAEFVPGPDSLFMFKNNQCKPECCGASFSCGGGCVCTTPQQRQYIASRGGNRTQPEDSA
jgi:hypothetical protein